MMPGFSQDDLVKRGAKREAGEYSLMASLCFVRVFLFVLWFCFDKSEFNRHLDMQELIWVREIPG